ncbi:uncharacterized protein [Primulina huaijiensis]|uniref:uncharacterized protein n=1 Tax=Primulina huaijiensis TaxID=1492673 RepID=UPI003CC6E740
MMLDDFFTLTEMNHGLTSPSRVMELVAVMQKGRNGTANAGDTIRQCSALASTIAATENKDCLDLFILLDGVQFIDKWLKAVQKFNNDSDKIFPEETIIHLLQALETLHMNDGKLVASEIWVTVEDLLVHGSSKVQGKARVLFESWKFKRNGVDSVSVEKVGALLDEMDESDHVQRGSGCSKSPSRYSSPSSDFSGLDKGQESATDEQVPSTVSEALHRDPFAGACSSNKILDTPVGDDRASDQVVLPFSKPAEGFPMSVPRQGMNDGLAEFPKLESTGDLIHAPKIECSSEKSVSLEESNRSENKAMSASSDAADANKSVMEHENKNSWDEGPPFIKIDSGGKDVVDDGSCENKCRSSSLDLSCQISIQVESGAVDSKEQGCSSEKPPEGHIRQPYNLDPVSESQSHDNEGSHNKVMNIPELSAEASPIQEFATCIENPGTAQTSSSTKDMETSQVTEVDIEEARARKGPCKFDLNQEVCSEDIDHLGNQTGTTSIVSASMDAHGLPVSPMQFAGNLGWKGSADQNDSLPASPDQSPSTNEDLTIGVLRSTPKPPRGFYKIDLNIAESGDGNTRDLLHHKQVSVYSGLPSWESSMETDSRKSERPDLDLNLTSEDNGVPSASRIGHHLPKENDRQHQSRSSSASSKQPLSIIDLNDQPFFLNDSYDISCSSNVNVSGGIKTDESIISILGARVKVNPKDLVPQTIPFPNGRTPELTLDVKVGSTESSFVIGSVLPYAHSSVYGYKNVAPVPEVAASPFSSSLCGSGEAIPYMVDSRGSPVIPQIAGAGFSQPLFVSNMMSSIPSDGAGPSGSSFVLNSGAMVKDGGRDPLVLRDFLNLGPIRSMDDQLRTHALPTVSSVVSGKRKEIPDDGLERYPFRNFTPPWK